MKHNAKETIRRRTREALQYGRFFRGEKLRPRTLWSKFRSFGRALEMRVTKIRPARKGGMLGAGMRFRGKNFITHSTLDPSVSSIVTVTTGQKTLFSILLALFAIGLAWKVAFTLTVLVSILSVLYFIDFLFSAYLVKRSLVNSPEISISEEELQNLSDKDLPVYTILCPLYREAHMLPGYIRSIEKLDWPKNKLDVLLLLEEDDMETVRAAEAMDLPRHIRILVVPDSQPKTKPKACNYGLGHAKGEYVVIYDAEDIPDSDQLKKAYLGFQKVGDRVKCLQGKLNYFNPDQNLLTRFFTAEYSLWFDVILSGLQSLNTSIPLGGTSNHFRTKDLVAFEGWDPFNVTEDCDLGARIFARGYRTAIINSTTLEEANSHLGNWIRQRSRWIKGYIQTYLVHMRNPFAFFRKHGKHAILFQLVVGGKIAFLIVNPFLWVTTIIYFLFTSTAGVFIESLYLPAPYVMALISLVFGNFFYLYSYMIGCARRGHWQLLKYVFLIPIYWVLMSIAAAKAVYQLIVKPYYWEKTVHGLGQRKTVDSASNISSAPFTPNAPDVTSTAASASVLFEPDSATEAPREDAFKKWRQLYEKSLKAGRDIFLEFRGHVFSSAGLLIGAMIVTNILNLLYNAYIGRRLSYEDIGIIVFINTLWTFAMVFIGPFGASINHHVSFISASMGKSAGASFFKKMLVRGAAVMAMAGAVWAVLTPMSKSFFLLPSVLPLLSIAPIFLFGLIAVGNEAFLKGNLMFRAVSLVLVSEALAKIFLVVLLSELGYEEYAYFSIVFSVAAAAFVSYWYVRRHVSGAARETDHTFQRKFYVAALLSSVSSTVFLSIDVILVKHYLSPDSAGVYALLSLVGKMVFFVGALPSVFILPLVSRAEGNKADSSKFFWKIFALTSFLVWSGVVFLALFGSFAVPFVFGEKAIAVLPNMTLYALAMALFSLSDVIVTYYLAKRAYMYAVAGLMQSIFLVSGIALYHGSIGQIISVIWIVSLGGFLALFLMHIWRKKVEIVFRNVVDILGAFVPFRSKAGMEGVRNILILNWRDTKHAYAGGAETYVHEIARRWVKDGYNVTQFCGNDSMSARYEVIDGVEIYRRGGFYFVYAWAALYYILKFRGRFDVIVDCHNGIPFFTPAYSRKPVYCLMHHVHQEVFRRHLPRPLAMFAQFLEKDLMPLVYRKVPFITVSESSKKDMQKIGMGKAGIQIVYPGVNLDALVPGEKSKSPTVMYFGRLQPYKSVDVLVRAFKKVLRSVPNATLVIAGSGDEEENLKQLVRDEGILKSTIFAGRVSDKEKTTLFQRAWIAVNPSFMEGWGITTVEANACATPVVASNVHGLRDSVKNPHTGYLVPYGDEDAFAERIVELLKNDETRERMSQEATEWAKKFDWEKLQGEFLEIILSHKKN